MKVEYVKIFEQGPNINHIDVIVANKYEQNLSSSTIWCNNKKRTFCTLLKMLMIVNSPLLTLNYQFI